MGWVTFPRPHELWLTLISWFGPEADNRPRPAKPLAPIWLDVLKAAGVATLFLAVAAAVIDVRQIHISGAGNDQVSYVTVARNYLSSGRLHNNIIYPSQLNVPATKDYFYMPGYYYALVASFAAFGYGEFQAHLPSLVSFVVTAVAVFVIATRFVDRRRAYLSVAIYLAFPANITYACSALCEMSVTAAATVMFMAFVLVPERWRWIVGPALLVPAFLFRETSAFLVVPMAILMLAPPWRRNISKALAFAAMSTILLYLVYISDLAAGRPNLLKANVLDGSFQAIYNDAFLVQENHASATEWLMALVANALWNVGDYLESLGRRPLSMEVLSITAILVNSGIAFRQGLRKSPFGRFEMAAGAFTLTMLAFVLLCYGLMDKKGIRLLLTTCPLLNIVLADWSYSFMFAENAAPRRLRPHALACGGVLLFVATIVSTSIRYHRIDKYDQQCLEFLEQVGHDDRKVLVSSPSYAFPYILKHYPVKWAFVPAERRTLQLLASRYELGTIVHLCDDPKASLVPTDLDLVNFSADIQTEFGLEEFVIYRTDRRATDSPVTATDAPSWK